MAEFTRSPGVPGKQKASPWGAVRPRLAAGNHGWDWEKENTSLGYRWAKAGTPLQKVGRKCLSTRLKGRLVEGVRTSGAYLPAREVVTGPRPGLLAHYGTVYAGAECHWMFSPLPHTIDNWMVIISKMKHSRGEEKEMLRGSRSLLSWCRQL